MIKGNLYGIGVGPGDPDLLTIKAKKILESVSVVIAPKMNKDTESVALSIASIHIPKETECIEILFSKSADGCKMTKEYENALTQIIRVLDDGKSIAFLSLGDPSVYSAYMSLHEDVASLGYYSEVVPGITPFCASAARAGMSLVDGDAPFVVIPASEKMDKLHEVLGLFDNIVLMKVSKQFDEIKDLLHKAGLSQSTVMVEKCTMPDESLTHGIDSVEEAPGYFTTMIVKKNKNLGSHL